VRRLHSAARSRHTPRLDGGEAKTAFGVGGDAPEAAPAFLDGLVLLLVFGMGVLAGREETPMEKMP
jgi:hypothetical protein